MASSIKTVVILSRRLHYFRWAESDSGETEPMGTSHHSNSFRKARGNQDRFQDHLPTEYHTDGQQRC
jgi:hypothetical protein